MQLNGESITEYVSPYDILFGDAREYSAVEGVTTFRGNNFRDDATYGAATNVIDKKTGADMDYRYTRQHCKGYRERNMVRRWMDRTAADSTLARFHQKRHESL